MTGFYRYSAVVFLVAGAVSAASAVFSSGEGWLPFVSTSLFMAFAAILLASEALQRIQALEDDSGQELATDGGARDQEGAA